MKVIILFISMLLNTNAMHAQQKEIDEVATAAEALRLVMIDPVKERLDQLTMDSLSYGHSSGHIDDKKEFIARLLDGRSDFVSIDITDQTIQIYDNTAILRHTLNAVTNDNNKAGEIKLFVLLVWIKQKGKWKLAARQAVRVGS